MDRETQVKKIFQQTDSKSQLLSDRKYATRNNQSQQENIKPKREESKQRK